MEERWACLRTKNDNSTVKFGSGSIMDQGCVSANGTGNISKYFGTNLMISLENLELPLIGFSNKIIKSPKAYCKIYEKIICFVKSVLSQSPDLNQIKKRC